MQNPRELDRTATGSRAGGVTRRRGKALVAAAALRAGAVCASPPASAGGRTHAGRAAEATLPRAVQNGRIGFNLDPGTGARIMTMSPDGTRLRTLVRYRHAAAESPDWSPHGYRLVYSRVTGTGCHVVLARRDGTHRHDLTGSRAGCESSPTFSPSGRRIIFVLQRCDSCRTWIAGMDLRGRDRHRILAVARGTFPEDVVLAPSGRRLAFESTGAKPFHRALMVARRDGTHVRTLVRPRFDVGVHFDWSPTGRWLVYTRWSESPPGHESNVVLIRPDGSHARHVTHAHRSGRAAGGATFAPDGRQIVYRFANLDKPAYWLCVMRLDGSGKTRIRHLSIPPQGTAWAPRIP